MRCKYVWLIYYINSLKLFYTANYFANHQFSLSIDVVGVCLGLDCYCIQYL